MERTTGTHHGAKLGILIVAAAVLVVVMLPLLAVVAFSLRFVVAAVLLAAIVAVAVSPALRRWISSDTELATSYLGLRMPGDEQLFPQHTWARIEGRNQVTVGADDLAQRVIGPLELVDLPSLGRTVEQGDVLMRLRRGKRELALRAPVAGTVTAVNEQLRARPTLLNEAPYGLGWAAVVAPRHLAASRSKLRRGGAARVWLRGEIDKLMMAMTPASPVYALQDGGHLVDDVHAHIDEPTFADIKARFFGGEG